jgi:hypothetical protein
MGDGSDEQARALIEGAGKTRTGATIGTTYKVPMGGPDAIHDQVLRGRDSSWGFEGQPRQGGSTGE